MEARIQKHLNLIRAILSDLPANSAVAFALCAFGRQRKLLDAFSIGKAETRAAVVKAENDWWDWCLVEDKNNVPTTDVCDVVGLELGAFLDGSRRPRSMVDVVEHHVLATCEGLFRDFAGSEFWSGKFSAIMNVGLVELFEGEVESQTLSEMIELEIERQEGELLILVDGVSPATLKILQQQSNLRLLGPEAEKLLRSAPT